MNPTLFNINSKYNTLKIFHNIVVLYMGLAHSGLFPYLFNEVDNTVKTTLYDKANNNTKNQCCRIEMFKYYLNEYLFPSNGTLIFLICFKF